MSSHFSKEIGGIMEQNKINPADSNMNEPEVSAVDNQNQVPMTKSQSAVTESAEMSIPTETRTVVQDSEVEIQPERMTAEPEAEPQSEKEQSNAEKWSNQKGNNVKSEQQTETVIIKKGGTGIGLLALLIALGLGGAGYYFGQQQVADIQQKLTALDSKVEAQSNTSSSADFSEQENQQLAELMNSSKTAQEKIVQLEQELALKQKSLSSLQNQINSIKSQAKPAQPNDWLLSEADFLLNNALRKLVLDNDVDTGISLLKLASEALEKVTDSRVDPVRKALNSDLKQLLSVNSVDQNAIMQSLSQLANNLDELEVLNINFDANIDNGKLSDSIEDWKENAGKSAVSFLNHFIRIKERQSTDKALLAPNQDIYLRENIRLRLQVAMLAVPRQQDDLYKQSLETVASWVRTYFNTNTQGVQEFLKSIDELAEQSIYVDVPSQLASLNALDKLLDRQSQEVKKIEISADKELVQPAAETKDEKSAVENSQPTEPVATQPAQ